jgi:predicted amino acid dehydrogenase
MANLVDRPIGYDPTVETLHPYRGNRISSFEHRILAGAKFLERIPDYGCRRWPRRHVRMDACLKLHEAAWRGVVSDISLGGVCLFFKEIVPAVHNQSLEIGLLTEAGVLEIRGAIRGGRPASRTETPGVRQTGQSLTIEFQPLDMTTELVLASFLDALHEQAVSIKFTGTLVPVERRLDTPPPSHGCPELTPAWKSDQHFGDRRVTSRFAVGVPVIVDIDGRLSNGVSRDLSLDSLAVDTDLQAAERAPVSVRFFLAQHPTGLNVEGSVVAIRENGPESNRRFRLVFRFHRMTDRERAALESVLLEFGYSAPTSPSGVLLVDSGTDSEPIRSFFVTNNPSPLRYGRNPRLDHDTRHGMPLEREEGERERRINGTRKASGNRFAWTLLPHAMVLALQVARDLLLRLLPQAVARLVAPRIAFAFIAHPRDLADVPRKFPLAYFLPTRLVDLWFLIQWPFVASYITGLRTKSGKKVTGAMIISPLTTAQMIRNPRAARTRVCQAVKLAEKMGAKVVGLGAFTSIVTKDGNDLLGKVNVGITTGNPHSAAIAVQNVLMAASLTGLSLPHATAAIVGGAGSVGSACAKLLSSLVGKLVLVDIKQVELQKLLQHLRPHALEVAGTAQIEAVKHADIVIVATNSPHILISADHLKPGAIVIDAAQPKNVSEQIPLQRKDVLVVESAIVNTPTVDCHFDLGLGHGEALGCLSETMILSGIGWEGHYSLGKADPSQAAEMIAAGRNQGFRLAHFRNSIGYITEENLAQVARARMKRRPLPITA